MAQEGNAAALDHGERVRYRAFISYSHADLAAAKRLHRQLEGYRLPRQLVGRETARGPVERRLRPIFRDIDELPASDDLSTEIKDALAASQALIVVASPSARASHWVGREIETFRAIHGGGRPVFVALHDGEPNAAFPAALFADDAEPIAADFRKGGDGSRLALMKLVAGLTGLDLDTLVQRDAHARLRRVTAITGIALVAVLVMALLLMVALRARSEADLQRAKAEGLVEYMLTDLREKLKGVGRLDVMAAVNERAMAYYGDQASLEQLPPDSLDRRARILHAMGEDDEKRGNLDLALQKFQEAHRATAAVLAQRPKDVNAIFAHAQSEYWVGEVLLRRDRLADVEPHFQAYLRYAEQLVAIDPANADWQRERGYATGNLCTLSLAYTPPRADSLARCKSALDQMRVVLALNPADRDARLNVANRLAWLADAWKAGGNLVQAQTARLEQEAIVAALMADAREDKGLREIWLKTELMTAEIFALRGDRQNARQRLDAANQTHRDLIAFDPSNHQWKAWSEELSRVETIIKRSR